MKLEWRSRKDDFGPYLRAVLGPSIKCTVREPKKGIFSANVHVFGLGDVLYDHFGSREEAKKQCEETVTCLFEAVEMAR
jgi:hypothetical protein